jgi:hypothetical protein
MLTAPEYMTDESGEPIDYSVEPIQIATPDSTIPVIEHNGNRYTLMPKATYQISGMLVSTKRYRNGYMSWLSPYDYAIIWGKAPEYLPYIKFDQIVRFCLFKFKSDAPIDVNYFSEHMGNNHMIPATPNLRKALGMAKKKDLVTVNGYLVYVLGQDKKKGFTNWNSSLSRDDKGNGACEIIYVTSLRINDRVYK